MCLWYFSLYSDISLHFGHSQLSLFYKILNILNKYFIFINSNVEFLHCDFYGFIKIFISNNILEDSVFKVGSSDLNYFH